MLRTVAIALIGVWIGAQADALGAAKQVVETKITAVTVYNDRARVMRSAPLTLEPGSHLLVLADLPAAADEASVRAQVVGQHAFVLGLNQRVEPVGVADHASTEKLRQEIATLRDRDRAAISDRLAILEKQQEMLEAMAAASTALGGEVVKTGFDARNWENAYGFVSRHLYEVVDSTRELNLRLAAIDVRLDELDSRLVEIQAAGAKLVRRAEIEVQIDAVAAVELHVEYVLTGASWRPLYHARLGDSNLVMMSCFGQVRQNTGEDWNDVEITLSTAQPGRTATPGELVPRLLSVREVMQQFGNVHIRGGRNGEVEYVIVGERSEDRLGSLDLTEQANISTLELEAVTVVTAGFDAEYGDGNPGIVNPAYILATEYSTQFRVRSRQTIPSGGEVVRTPINEWTMAGDSRLVVRPRNQLSAFRFVTLTNETGVPLLPGQINLFAGADFIGSLSSPFLVMPTQKFELAFGIDDRIEVKREIANQRRSASGDSRKLEETVVITLINHSPNTEEVELEEALPVSSDSRIKVKTKAITPKGDDSMGQGINRWQLELQPGIEAVVSVTYEIEHPASLQLLGM